jgi:MFS transporter, DHA2 family, multidrug resistance protein
MSLGKFANYLWNRISKGQEWDWPSDPFWRVQTLAILFVVGLVGMIF